MPTLKSITEADLGEVLKASSLRRARGYLTRVKKAVRAGQRLSAEVKGSRNYQVEIEVGPEAISAHCSCPYDWGGFCKHIGAVLLKWIQSPVSFNIQDAPARPADAVLDIKPVAPLATYRPEQTPAWLAFPFPDRQAAGRGELADWLAEVSLQDLRAIAGRRGWQVRGTRKAEVVSQIVDLMGDPENVRQVVLSLNDETRKVLAALALLDPGTHLMAAKLESLLGQEGSPENRRRLVGRLRQLVEMGLVLPGEVVTGYPPRSDFIPHQVARSLPPILAGRLPVATAPSSEIEIILADPHAFVRLVNQVALLLGEGRTPLTLRAPMPRLRLETFYPNLKGWDYDPAEILRAKQENLLRPYSKLTLMVPPPLSPLPDETAESLAPVVPDRTQLEFIFALLLGAGVFQPGSPLTIWPMVRERLLSLDDLAQRAALARTYFLMQNWSELWDLLRDSKRLQVRRRYTHGRPENLPAELAGFRCLVLRTLTFLPDGEWVTLDDLASVLHKVWPAFDSGFWEVGNLAGGDMRWFIASRVDQEPLSPSKSEDWEQAQGEFVRRMIAGPLHWLGFADLGRDDKGRLAAVRFHGLADLFWDRVEAPPAPPHASDLIAPAAVEAVTIDGDSISIKPSFVTPGMHRFLDAIARLDVASVEHFVYSLDPQAIHETFEMGGTLEEILEDWPVLVQTAMPAGWRKQLGEWWEAYGQVRIYQDLTVIEFGDDDALEELKVATSLPDSLVAEITPRLVIIAADAAPALAAELEKAGYTPKQTDQV